MSGFVKAQRDRFAHPLFTNEKFCRGYAWDWIVAEAAYTERKVDVSGKIITLQRGQLAHSIRFIAKAWGWDKAAVSRFITRLKTETMIETATETGVTIITVCNYNKYQDRASAPETATETAPETGARQHRDRLKEGEEGKKVGGKPPTTPVPRERPHQGALPLVIEGGGGKPVDPVVAALTTVASFDAAKSFIAFRKGIKKPLTETGAKRLASNLRQIVERGGDADDALGLAEERGWQGMKPDWYFRENPAAPGLPDEREARIMAAGAADFLTSMGVR